MLFLILIFVVILFFALLPEFIPGISKKMVDLSVQENEEESHLRRKLKELQSQQKDIHMVDEFAKYAKVERQIVQTKEKLASYTKSKSEVFLKFKVGINIVYHVINIMVMLFFIWNYRSEPILMLPSEWFTPINRIIAFPTGVPGGLGITFWILACRNVIKKGIRHFKPSPSH